MPPPRVAVADEGNGASDQIRASGRADSVAPRKTWTGALLLGTTGGLVLGALEGAVFNDNEWYWSLICCVVGFICFGAIGFVWLPAGREVDDPVVRGLMEGLVVAGWLAAVAYKIADAIENGFLYGTVFTRSFSVYSGLYTLNIFFFFLSPIAFVVLLWGNIDFFVLRLLWQQFQCKMVVLLTVDVVVMYAWRVHKRHPEVNVLFFICLSILTWLPLIMILFLDAMRRQSSVFRIILPVVYVVYVLVGHTTYGYLRTNLTLIFEPDVNSTGAFQHEIVTGNTFEGQLSSALSTLGLLMLSFLYNTIRDKSGTAVLFPLRITTVMKSSVEMILAAGMTRTEVDEERDRMVLVPMEADGPSAWPSLNGSLARRGSEIFSLGPRPRRDDVQAISEEVRDLPDVPASPDAGTSVFIDLR